MPFQISLTEGWFEADGVRTQIPDEFRPVNIAPGIVMLPLRLVAAAFAGEDFNLTVNTDTVQWDPIGRAATITIGTRSVRFIVDDPYMEEAGRLPMLMQAGDGSPAPARIFNDRMFIPLRPLGDALGVSRNRIGWDGGAQIASFNMVEAAE
jgi:hypothetical protein